MKITVWLQGKRKGLELPAKAKAIDAVQKMGVNPETVLVKRGSEILIDEEHLEEDDEVELIKIVSGG